MNVVKEYFIQYYTAGAAEIVFFFVIELLEIYITIRCIKGEEYKKIIIFSIKYIKCSIYYFIIFKNIIIRKTVIDNKK